MPKGAKLLSSSLKEELAAATKITAAGIPIVRQSAQEPEEPKKPKTGKEKYSAKKSKEDEAKAARDLKRSESDTPAHYARAASVFRGFSLVWGEPFSFTQISISDCALCRTTSR
jgi:hypothetical protein